MKNIDAFELTANLIKCPSVTPDEGGAITLLDDLLSQTGSNVHASIEVV